MKVRDAIKEWFDYRQMKVVFGNPGSTEVPFLIDWPQTVSYILGLQESQVVAMADGYAQASGAPGLVNLHTQPGLGHAMGALMTAKKNQTPLIVTIGQEDTRHHIIDPLLYGNLLDMAAPVSQWSYQVTSPDDIVPALERAYHEAKRPPKGPAVVSLPMNFLEGSASWTPHRDISYQALPDGLDQLVSILNDAQNPALVIGDEVDREEAWHEAVALAEALDCPVYGAPLSPRIGFPNRHPLFQGTLTPAMTAIIQKLTPHDVVVVIGAPAFLIYPHLPGSREWSQTRLCHISSNPEYLARSVAEQGYCGSVRLALRHLIQSIPERTPQIREVNLQDARQKSTAARQRSHMGTDYVLYTIAQSLPDNTVVIDESVSHSLILREMMHFTRPGSYYTAANGALGWGLAAAAGVQLAQPDRRVLAVVGDGASLYGIQSLWTLKEYQLPVVIVVLNNQGYNILKSLTQSFYPGHLHTTPGFNVAHVDYACIAQGFGLLASGVHSPDDLESALMTAWSSHQPYLLDVHVDSRVPAFF